MQETTGEMNTKNENSEDSQTRKSWLSFWSLLILQTQNAFNDKAAQFLLIPIGAWLVLTGARVPGADKIEYILAAVIVLPFILFSPLSGWISDRFSKTMVVRAASILQLVVLAWVSASIYFQQLWLAVMGFFLLSVQSVILSPAKKGLVKELVGRQKLGFASGLLEIFVILAICSGQIITGFWFSARLKEYNDGWVSAFFPMLVLTLASLLTLCVSFTIQKTPTLGQRQFQLRILTEHFGQLRELLSERSLRLSAFGVAFFWGYAGFLNLTAIRIPKQLTGGGGDFAMDSAILMSAASLGIVAGGAIASVVCRRKIELGLVPLGGLIMVVGSLALALTPITSVWLRLWLFVAGLGGAIFLVPLNANIQDLCPPEKRGKILAGLGLLDCLFGLSAVGIQLGFMLLDVSFAWQFAGLALSSLITTVYAARILPQHFVRMVVLAVFKVFYRIHVLNADRVPKEGGVLMTPNHVSYIDAFILSAASPRKVRFLMFDGYFKRPWIGKFVRLFDTVPISQTKAKEAMKVAAEALEEGYLVCMFPEGQLTRSGGMNEFKRGFELIAKKAKCPVLPAVMDGLWGSIFSYERGRFIYKIPYTFRYCVRVNFGEIIAPEEIQAKRVRSAVLELRAEAFTFRSSLGHTMSVLGEGVEVLAATDPSLIESYTGRVRELREQPTKRQRELVGNALQLGDIHAISRGKTVMIEWTGLGNCRDVLAIALAQYLQLKLVLVNSELDVQSLKKLQAEHGVDHFVGGSELSKTCAEAGLLRVCFDFSEHSVGRHNALPCLVAQGRVIAMSMPHPDAQTATNQHQEGYREGTWGRILPGYKVTSQEGAITVSGVSIGSAEGLRIEGVQIDLQGFVESL